MANRKFERATIYYGSTACPQTAAAFERAGGPVELYDNVSLEEYRTRVEAAMKILTGGYFRSAEIHTSEDETSIATRKLMAENGIATATVRYANFVANGWTVSFTEEGEGND